MAISTGAAILGGAAISGLVGARSSRSASRAQQQAADQATAEQRRQYDLSRQDLAPYRQVGTQAMNQLASLYGFTPYAAPQQTQATGTGGSLEFRNVGGRLVPTGSSYRLADLGTNWMADGPGASFANMVGTVANGMNGGPIKQPGTPMAQPQGMAGFFGSPDYNFRRSEGLRGIEQSAAARGGALSGNALRATTNFSSDLASQEFGNYYNRLANLAGIGQTATNTGVVAGQNYANQAGANAMAAGAARASGIMGQTNSITGAINSGLNNYMLYQGGWFGGGGGGYNPWRPYAPGATTPGPWAPSGG